MGLLRSRSGDWVGMWRLASALRRSEAIFLRPLGEALETLETKAPVVGLRRGAAPAFFGRVVAWRCFLPRRFLLGRGGMETSLCSLFRGRWRRGTVSVYLG